MKIEILAIIGGLSIAGCSTPHVVIDARINQPASKTSNHMVMAAEDMEDLDAADQLVALTEEGLRRRGYRSNFEADADVVVVTRATSISPSGTEVPIRATKHAAGMTPADQASYDDFGSVAALAMGSPDGLNSARFERFPAGGLVGTAEPMERFRVTVKAASMKEWMKPQTTFEDLPALWVVTAEGLAPHSQRTKFLEQAVIAASTYFAQDVKQPQKRAVSLRPPERPAALSVAARSEPDLTLDPLR